MKRDSGREVRVAALDKPDDCLPLKHGSPSYMEEMFAFPQDAFRHHDPDGLFRPRRQGGKLADGYIGLGLSRDLVGSHNIEERRVLKSAHSSAYLSSSSIIR